MKNNDTAVLSPLVSAADYDPTGDRLREYIRATIEAVFTEELEAFLGRPHARAAWLRVDWDASVARDLDGEDIIRLILEATVIKTRFDRKPTKAFRGKFEPGEFPFLLVDDSPCLRGSFHASSFAKGNA